MREHQLCANRGAPLPVSTEQAARLAAGDAVAGRMAIAERAPWQVRERAPGADPQQSPLALSSDELAGLARASDAGAFVDRLGQQSPPATARAIAAGDEKQAKPDQSPPARY